MEHHSLIEVSIGMDSGTTAECECGWRVNMPPGVMPQIVTDHVQAHEAKTGHHWPTESEALAASECILVGGIDLTDDEFREFLRAARS